MKTWEAFLERLKSLRAFEDSQLLYRGQANGRWKLETTLERRGKPVMLLADYYKMILVRVLPHVESLTDRRWEMPGYEDLINWFPNDYDEKSLLFSSGKLPNAEFFLYLRHHGFPSPLLDWTRSPYVGAFFAFAERSSAPTRAIYVWQKPDVWSGGTDEPEIHRIGPYIRAHPRHVFQQSEYTYGVRYETASKRWFFVPQHDALSAPVSPPQCLWRFILPSTERTKVLEFLHSCNVTPHSLFGTDDGLMETLGLREFDLKG